MNAVIVGSGIVGLCAAKKLADSGWKVIVVSDKQNPDIGSHEIGFHWNPLDENSENTRDAPPVHLVSLLTKRTLDFYDDIVSRTGPFSGIVPANYIDLFSHRPVPKPWWRPLIHNFNSGRSEDFENIYGSRDIIEKYPYTYQYTAPLINPDVLFPYLQSNLAAMHVPHVTSSIISLYDASRPPLHACSKGANPPASILINASGLGARYLAKDSHVYPLRVQSATVAPLKPSKFVHDPLTFRILEQKLCISSCSKGIFHVGASMRADNSSLAVSEQDHHSMVSSSLNMCPKLFGGNLKELSRDVTITAGRHGGPRIEVEQYKNTPHDKDTLMIGHAYGMGADSWTYGPGAGTYIAEAAMQRFYEHHRGGRAAL